MHLRCRYRAWGRYWVCFLKCATSSLGHCTQMPRVTRLSNNWHQRLLLWLHIHIKTLELWEDTRLPFTSSSPHLSSSLLVSILTLASSTIISDSTSCKRHSMPPGLRKTIQDCFKSYSKRVTLDCSYLLYLALELPSQAIKMHCTLNIAQLPNTLNMRTRANSSPAIAGKRLPITSWPYMKK